MTTKQSNAKFRWTKWLTPFRIGSEIHGKVRRIAVYNTHWALDCAGCRAGLCRLAGVALVAAGVQRQGIERDGFARLGYQKRDRSAPSSAVVDAVLHERIELRTQPHALFLSDPVHPVFDVHQPDGGGQTHGAVGDLPERGRDVFLRAAFHEERMGGGLVRARVHAEPRVAHPRGGPGTCDYHALLSVYPADVVDTGAGARTKHVS